MDLDIPDVENFLFTLSCWDFNNELVDEKNIVTNIEDDYNNLMNLNDLNLENSDINVIEADKNKKNPTQLENLKIKYSSFEEYISLTYNLFIIECKAQISRAKQIEMENSELFTLKDGKLEKKFFAIEFTKVEKNESVQYSVGDIVVISTDKVTSKYCSNNHCLGIVDKIFYNSISIKISMNLNNERITSMVQIFKKGIVLNITRICNLATNLREYQALISIESFQLADILLHPGEINNLNIDKTKDYFSIPEKLDIKIKEYFDQSQYKALKASIRKKGVTLIQGPPGTGKSTTILGILSVILNSSIEIHKQKLTNQKSSIKKESSKSKSNKLSLLKHQPWLYDPSNSEWLDNPIVDNDLLELKGIKVNNKKEDTFSNCFDTDNFITLLKSSTEDIAPPERVLVCAPSNVAIDEIVRKIISIGLFNYDGQKYAPNFVRIGPNYHPSIEEYSLDYLVTQKLQSNDGKEIEKLKQEILMNCKIICSTLSMAGSNILLNLNQKFDTVIIDEAGQSVEISSLIPLRYNCERLILVGDPKQLSATVFSRTAMKYNYEQSLFKRFQLAGQEVTILTTQYRMNPYLSKFISQTFYEGKLEDGPNIVKHEFLDCLKVQSNTNTKSKTKESKIQKELCLNYPAFQPFVFFDIESKEFNDNNSCYNEHQVNFVNELVKQLLKIYDKSSLIEKLAIISPYSMQVIKIKNSIKKLFDQDELCPIEINTVDGFQGKEKDIVIFSTVRSKGSKSIGFLKDEKRINVGLSRAKQCLIVVGDSKKLILDKNWEALVKYSFKEAVFYKVFGNLSEYLINLERELINKNSLVKVNTEEDFIRAVYSN